MRSFCGLFRIEQAPRNILSVKFLQLSKLKLHLLRLLAPNVPAEFVFYVTIHGAQYTFQQKLLFVPYFLSNPIGDRLAHQAPKGVTKSDKTCIARRTRADCPDGCCPFSIIVRNHIRIGPEKTVMIGKRNGHSN